MNKIYRQDIGETLYHDRLKNGLDVYYIHKEGFSEKYAVLGVDFGSDDTDILCGEKISLPDGIAHFLEHKMFEQEDGENVFDKFGRFGANVNAYTSHSMTAYLFSCTKNFYTLLAYLIDFVSKPYYTDENVEKEKGIIIQELKMYEDDPESVLNNNCMSSLYFNKNIKNNIGGSEESVKSITKEDLYLCYDIFYKPSNMKLVIVGDLDFREIIQCLENTYKNIPNRMSEYRYIQVHRISKEEPISVKNRVIEKHMTVSAPLVQIGYKDLECKLKGRERLKFMLITNILIDMIFTESGDLSQSLYENGDVISTPYGGFSMGKDYSYASILYISKFPDKVRKIIDEYIANLRRDKLDIKMFELTKKKIRGSFITSLDTVSFIGNTYLNYKMNGMDFLEYIEVLDEIKIEDIENRLNNFLYERDSTISVVHPIGKEDEQHE